MAFGKNAQVRAKVGSFRQQSAAYTKKNFGGGGRKGPPYFVDMYKPSTEYIDTVRFLPGPFVDEEAQLVNEQLRIVPIQTSMKKFTEHYDGVNEKGAICSSKEWQKIEEQRKSCHGCDIFWETAERTTTGRLESSRMGRQQKYAFALYDYGMYHKVEQIDRQTGQPRVNKKKEPYYNWVKCGGQGCDMCQAGKEVKYGSSTHFPMNWTELQIIRAAESDVGASCKVCQTQNCITSLAWTCQGCGEACIDMSTSTLKKDELLKMTDEEFTCPHCSTKGLLVEVFECAVCSSRGQQGARASIFDVDMQLRYIVAGDKKVLSVVGFSIPYPITAAEVAKWPGIDKPQDIVKRYAPDSLEFQAQRFGIAIAPPPGPGQAPTPGPGVRQPMAGPPMPGPAPMPMQPPPPPHGVPVMQGMPPGFAPQPPAPSLPMQPPPQPAPQAGGFRQYFNKPQ